MQKSIRFFIMMFEAFLARVRPDSTIAKPACMKKTSTAVSTTHKVSAMTGSKGAGAGAGSSARALDATSVSGRAIRVASRSKRRMILLS